MHNASCLQAFVSAAWLLVLLPLCSACSYPGGRARPVLPDEQFGHRYEGRVVGRETLTIRPPDAAKSYFYYPAVVESLQVRHATFVPSLPGDAQRVEAEAIIKGTLPDDCSELHAVEQRRTGHIIHMKLEMRRPTGAVCSRIGRPFRFYTPLEGRYEPGDYIVKLNGKVFPFVVRPAGTSS